MDNPFNIVSFLNSAGLTGGDLAKALGMSNATVSAWKNGTRMPQYEELLKLMDMGMKFEDLFGEKRWNELKKARAEEFRDEVVLSPEECASIVREGILRLRSRGEAPSIQRKL